MGKSHSDGFNGVGCGALGIGGWKGDGGGNCLVGVGLVVAGELAGIEGWV